MAFGYPLSGNLPERVDPTDTHFKIWFGSLQDFRSAVVLANLIAILVQSDSLNNLFGAKLLDGLLNAIGRKSLLGRVRLALTDPHPDDLERDAEEQRNCGKQGTESVGIATDVLGTVFGFAEIRDLLGE